MKHKLSHLIKGAVVVAAAFFVGVSTTTVAVNTVTTQTTEASVARQYGGDYAKYQPSLYNNTGKDSFAISQIGGDVNGYIYDQPTYVSHANQAKSRGWRFHTYIWDQTGANQYQTQQMCNYFLSKIQAPYGSIVALDYEAGASGDIEANTNNILYGMRLIKQAGFTPMLYSYKPYLMAHVDIQRILAEFPNSLWVAGYQNGLSVWPNYGNFPSMNGVAIWQYSDYGGQQDLNVDLTGITQNGYGNKQGQAPSKSTPVAQPVQKNGTKPKAEVIPQHATWRDSLGDTWHSEHGTFKASWPIAIKWGARTYSTQFATLWPGQTVKYDAWTRAQGYVWIRQPRANGGYAYLAVRDWSGPFGTFN